MFEFFTVAALILAAGTKRRRTIRIGQPERQPIPVAERSPVESPAVGVASTAAR